MNIYENPFYILGASLRDNRRRILALSEEKSLLLDSDKCLDARNALTNPQKRLSAEMSWFPGCSPKKTEEIVQYITSQKSENHPAIIETSSLEPIAKLNILINCFNFFCFNDNVEIAHAISDLNETFENLDANRVLFIINEDRTASGFPAIEKVTQIEEELHNIRHEIQSIINSRLTILPLNQYTKLVTMIAEDFVAANNDSSGAILDDIIDAYEINIQADMGESKERIVSLVNEIKADMNTKSLDSSINELILQTNQWDLLAQPLQVNAKAKGTRQEDSEELARLIRDFAVDLHNTQGKTAQSLQLVYMLKEVFTELPDFTELLEKDAETLKMLQAEQEEEEEDTREELSRNRLDKQYSVSVDAGNIAVPRFCTCCLKPTELTEHVSAQATEIQQAASFEMPICSECLKHRKTATFRKWWLILSIAVVAIVSVPVLSFNVDVNSNEFWVYSFVIAMTATLFGSLIIRLPKLSCKHSTNQQSVWMSGIDASGEVTFTFTNWRYAKLFAEANNADLYESRRRNRVKSTAFIKSIDHPIKTLFITLGVAGAVILVIGNSIPFVTGYANSGNDSAVDSSISSESANTQTKQQKLDAMEKDLDSRKKAIQGLESQLNGLSSDLGNYKSRYDSNPNSTNADLYNNTLDKYNNLYDDYNNAINAYNELVEEYNNLEKS